MRRFALPLFIALITASILTGPVTADEGHILPAPESTMPLELDLGNRVPAVKDEPPKVTPKVLTRSTWPSNNAQLIVPPREARVTFDKAVRPVDVSLTLIQLTDGAQKRAATRTEVSPDLTTVRFSLPLVERGAWKMVWTAASSTGEVVFTVSDPIEAPGGGNHREHSGLLTGIDLLERIALIGILFLGALPAFGRRRLLQIAGFVTASYIGVVAAIESVELIGNSSALPDGTESLAQGIAAPGLWSWLLIFGIGVTLAIGSKLSVQARAALVVVATAVHTTAIEVHTVSPTVILIVSAALLTAVALLAVFVISQQYSAATPDRHALLGVLTTFVAVVLFTVWARSNFGTLEHNFGSAFLKRAVGGALIIGLGYLLTVLPESIKHSVKIRRAIFSTQILGVALLTTPSPLNAGLGGLTL